MMCCSPNREAVRAATHYYTRAWQTLIYKRNVISSLLYGGVDGGGSGIHYSLKI